MAHAFIEEEVFVPGRRAVHQEPANLQWALMDLKVEGIEHINSIAADYGLDPKFLMGRFVRTQDIASY